MRAITSVFCLELWNPLRRYGIPKYLLKAFGINIGLEQWRDVPGLFGQHQVRTSELENTCPLTRILSSCSHFGIYHMVLTIIAIWHSSCLSLSTPLTGIGVNSQSFKEKSNRLPLRFLSYIKNGCCEGPRTKIENDHQTHWAVAHGSQFESCLRQYATHSYRLSFSAETQV